MDLRRGEMDLGRLRGGRAGDVFILARSAPFTHFPQVSPATWDGFTWAAAAAPPLDIVDPLGLVDLLSVLTRGDGDGLPRLSGLFLPSLERTASFPSLGSTFLSLPSDSPHPPRRESE